MRRPFRTLIRAVSTFQTLQVWVKSLGFLMESMVPWIINLDLFPFSQLPLGEQCKPGECPECWPDHLTTHPCQQDILLRNPVHMCHGPKTRIGHQSKRDVYTNIYKKYKNSKYDMDDHNCLTMAHILIQRVHNPNLQIVLVQVLY